MSTPPQARLAGFLFLTAALASSLACSGAGAPEAPEASTVTAPSAPPPAPPPEAAPRVDARGKPTRTAIKAAWAEVFDTAAAATEPTDKKIAAFVGRVGEPARIEDGKRIWFAADGAECFKLELLSEGTLGTERIFDAEVAKTECGISPAE